MPEVADYSWDRPDPATLATRFAGVVRYAPHGSAAVQLTKAEADALKAAGLDIAIVIQVGTKFVTEGFDRGALEATRSVAITRECGLPDGDVYVAVDFDATLGGPPTSATALAQMESIAQTFEGVASVVGRDHVRPYGGFHVLTWLYARLPWLKPGWQPRAWSQVGGVVTYHPNLALIQHYPSITYAGGLIDHNDVLIPDWGQRTTTTQEAPMDVKAALRTLGWRDGSAQSIEDFQRGWNLGTALSIDGNAGPKTVAALTLSLARKAKGLPDFSANFNASEFRCKCSPTAPACKRIFVRRAAVRAAEAFRTLSGPYSPVRASRCDVYNKQVGGVSNSQHLDGDAIDLPVFNITASQVKALGVVGGIGVYILPSGRKVVRHIDVRHLDAGSSATVSNPTIWDYGNYSGTVLTPNPGGTTSTPAEPPKEDSMSAADVAELKDHINKVLIYGYETGGTTYPGIAAVDIENQRRLTALRAEVSALTAAVGALSVSQGLDPAVVTAAVAKAVEDVAARLRFGLEDVTP